MKYILLKYILLVFIFLVVIGLGYTHEDREIIEYTVMGRCNDRNGKFYDTIGAFDEDINTLISDYNWQPIGGVSITFDTSTASKFYTLGYCIMQSMVKYAPLDDSLED